MSFIVGAKHTERKPSKASFSDAVEETNNVEATEKKEPVKKRTTKKK